MAEKEEISPADRARLQRANLDSERLHHFERHRTYIGPSEVRRQGWTNHAVGYAQTALRSMFLLNGGALIALPAFAEVIGDGLWARGQVWPILAFTVFVTGLVLCAVSTACAFYAMSNFIQLEDETIGRISKVLYSDYSEALGGEKLIDSTERSTTTAIEKASKKRGVRWETAAVVFFWGSLVLFVGGSVIGGYILSDTPAPKM